MKKPINWIVPPAVFVLSLFAPIPISYLSFFRDYSNFLFLILTIGFLAALSVKETYRWVVSTTFATLVFGLALHFKWASGYSDARLIGGLVPIKDGFSYTTGAENILSGLRLALENYQSAWRPLFPGMLSSFMLFIDQNLAVCLAVMVFLLGLAVAFASHAVYAEFDRIPSALFFSLLTLYILPFVGTVSTEVTGLLLGAFSLVIFRDAIRHEKILLFSLTAGVLMLAVSIRSGTYFVFPLIALWVGYRYPGSKRFSGRNFFLALALMAGVLLVLGWLYPRVMAPGVKSNGNFAYTLYGQVTGGTGWLQATKDAGRDTNVVYRAAYQHFLDRPFDFVIGSLKAFYQFFSPNHRAIFSFDRNNILDFAMWGGSYILFLFGVFFSTKNFKKPFHQFLLFVLAGFLTSIPFLPPIDGGRRFYASTVPYFFIIISSGLYHLLPKKTVDFPAFRSSVHISVLTSVFLFVFTVFIPPIILFAANPPGFTPETCEAPLEPFVTTIHRGNYIDLIPDGHSACGYIPGICLSDFETHAYDPYDFFVAELISSSRENQNAIRISPVVNLVNRRPAHFWIDTQLMTDDLLNVPVSGCARFRNIDNRHVYIVKTLSPIE